jgi:hypothetical protein
LVQAKLDFELILKTTLSEINKTEYAGVYILKQLIDTRIIEELIKTQQLLDVIFNLQKYIPICQEAISDIPYTKYIPNEVRDLWIKKYSYLWADDCLHTLIDNKYFKELTVNEEYTELSSFYGINITNILLHSFIEFNKVSDAVYYQ